MGVYIYTMRAKQGKIHLPGDVATTANLLAYAFKPYNVWPDEQPAVFQQILSRAENYWEGKETPDFFVIGDKFEDGCEVRMDWPKGKPWCYDEPAWPGNHVGYLKKIGRKWHVVSNDPLAEQEKANGL